MTAPHEVVELVERFDRNLDAYRSGRYKETQFRRESIDPFSCLSDPDRASPFPGRAARTVLDTDISWG